MCKSIDEMRSEARERIVEVLEDYSGYGCDFHNRAFNEDYYECYTAEAEKQLTAMGVFECIHYVQEYENRTFGEVYTDLSDPCKVLNMLWYIVGEEEMYELFDGCEIWDDYWNADIEEDEREQLINWLKEYERI